MMRHQHELYAFLDLAKDQLAWRIGFHLFRATKRNRSSWTWSRNLSSGDTLPYLRDPKIKGELT